MLFKALSLSILIIVTVLLAQPIEKRIVTFKFILEKGKAKSFSLLIFRRNDRKLVSIIRVLEGNSISISLSNKYEYIVGAYSRVGNMTYAGYKKVGKDVNEVTITLKPLPNLMRHLTRIILIDRRPLSIMSIELFVPFIGIVGRLKVSNQTAYVPYIPLVILHKEGPSTYYGIFLPEDKEIKLISSEEAKGETLIITVSRKVEGFQRSVRLGITTINFLRIIAIVILSLLIAYISYVTAKRYVKQQV